MKPDTQVPTRAPRTFEMRDVRIYRVERVGASVERRPGA